MALTPVPVDTSEYVTISHPDTPRRAIFSGPLKDCVEYLEKNFPRHSHDGNGGQIVSAQINLADGAVITHHDGAWFKDEEPVSSDYNEWGTTVTDHEPDEPVEPAEPDAPALEYPVV